MTRSFCFIRHRINKISALKDIPSNEGVEIDVRSSEGKLVLTHDVHTKGDSLSKYLREFSRLEIKGPVVFNVKEDGHEVEIVRLAKKNRIKNYFFLDLSMPTLVRLTMKERNPNVALRVSEYEIPAATEMFEGRAKWVWVDCFLGKPPAVSVIKKLSKKFRVCLVSPELQRFDPAAIRSFRHLLPLVDAVCTKYPALW